nr:MAG TPA: hypothetical protein [Caudoviricetes sp.]
MDNPNFSAKNFFVKPERVIAISSLVVLVNLITSFVDF